MKSESGSKGKPLFCLAEGHRGVPKTFLVMKGVKDAPTKKRELHPKVASLDPGGSSQSAAKQKWGFPLLPQSPHGYYHSFSRFIDFGGCVKPA